MIQAIVLDVDGILVASRPGFNHPMPNEYVLKRIEKLKTRYAVSLCTSRSYSFLEPIIDRLQLTSPQISYNGAVIDFLDDTPREIQVLDRPLIEEILNELLANNVYTEVYDLNSYYVQENQIGEYTNALTDIRKEEPVIVKDIINDTKDKAVLKLKIFTEPALIDLVKQRLHRFSTNINFGWSSSKNLSFIGCDLTPELVSKKLAVKKIMGHQNIELINALAVGDNLNDWDFMQACGYVATLENGTDDVKGLVRERGNGLWFIGKSVDENGILDVFDYFKLS